MKPRVDPPAGSSANGEPHVSHWRSFDQQAGEPRPLGESLDRLGRRLGAPSASALRTVFGHWVDLVGQDVAAHCRPRSLHHGTLVIVADHSAWAASLRYLGSTLLDRIAAATGPDVVKQIEVRVVAGGTASGGSRDNLPSSRSPH